VAKGKKDAEVNAAASEQALCSSDRPMQCHDRDHRAHKLEAFERFHQFRLWLRVNPITAIDGLGHQSSSSGSRDFKSETKLASSTDFAIQLTIKCVLLLLEFRGGTNTAPFCGLGSCQISGSRLLVTDSRLLPMDSSNGGISVRSSRGRKHRKSQSKAGDGSIHGPHH
jgi:hypothetical protein